jgi:hypothetical protein
MNKQKWTFLLIGLCLIGATAGMLVHMRTHQRLGKPGIRTAQIPGSKRLDVFMPANVLGYAAEPQTIVQPLLEGLPADTSFGRSVYTAPDKFQLLMNIVLMGTDRTSIHKPEFCLTGYGWNIDSGKSSPDTIRIESPHPYDLDVMKLVTYRDAKTGGKSATTKLCGIYVYWFVAENELTANHWVRMGRMSAHLLATGELQRWAYVSFFAVCLPQDEAGTYERMKKFIAASTPQFQKTTGAPLVPRFSPETAELH